MPRPFLPTKIHLDLNAQHSVALTQIRLVRQVHPATDVFSGFCEAFVNPVGQITVRSGFLEYGLSRFSEGIVDIVVELTHLHALLSDQLIKERTVLGVVFRRRAVVFLMRGGSD